jgi:hypothetical protein
LSRVDRTAEIYLKTYYVEGFALFLESVLNDVKRGSFVAGEPKTLEERLELGYRETVLTLKSCSKGGVIEEWLKREV